ncbi:hypothetical protein [Ellagibacter isourolithinifaciens]|uniref:hypothetical protein n=1 Tax=Ellagibacter isourolithinifaciens TaxID=2137581 RepID=UPI003AAE7B91
MRISDTERREVAENLRNLTIGRSIQYKEQFFDELAEVVVGFEDYHDFNVVLEKLADLIDRPTCKNSEYLYDGSFFECSKCGERWEMTCGSPADNNLNFCPRCGAEVVS